MNSNKLIDLVLVTGGTRGIGKKVAEVCAPRVGRVLAIGSVVGRHKPASSNIEELALDLANLDSVAERISELVANIKPQSVGFTFCAATLGLPGGLMGTDLHGWQRHYLVNVLGNLNVLKAVLASLSTDCSIRAVFFAGGGAAYGYPEFFSYGLTKVATVRAVENLAIEIGEMFNDFSVIALAPGAVDTDMLKVVLSNGGRVKTMTDVSEPANFVQRFFFDEIPSKALNGRFIHVRDSMASLADADSLGSQFYLRRIE